MRHSPVLLAIETTLGLEDYALESILSHLGGICSDTIEIEVDATLSSGHVLLRFPYIHDEPEAISGTEYIRLPQLMIQALRCFETGGLPAAKSAYLCIGARLLEEDLRAKLQNERRDQKSSVNRKQRKTPDPGIEESSGGKNQDTEGDQPLHWIPPGSKKPVTHGEMEFLAAIEGIIAESRPLMSSVLRQQFPNPKTYTFRATLDNPQHLIPFPTLYGQDIQRFTGDQVSKWLADYQSQEHPGGEKVPKEVDHSTLIESVRHSWRVDLVHPEVDVGIRLVSVPSEWNVRLIGPTADLLSSQIPSSNERLPKQVARPAFPSTIRILLTIKANKSVPDVVRPGRTALSPVTAHLLTWVHPVFSPFHPHNTAKPALTDDNPQCGATPVFLDPCCGTGAIPLEIVNSAYHQGLGVFVLCGDLVTHNAKDTIGLMSGVTGESNFDVVRWDVACIGSPLRAGTVDGIVTDLPWGHREATPRMIEKLYPKFLKTFARMMTFGGYVVVLTSARPLFKRLVQGNKKWKEIPLGKEWHIDAEDDGSSTWPQREVWVGGSTGCLKWDLAESIQSFQTRRVLPFLRVACSSLFVDDLLVLSCTALPCDLISPLALPPCSSRKHTGGVPNFPTLRLKTVSKTFGSRSNLS